MKILGFMAVVSAISMPVFADENSEDAFRPGPPHQREVTCTARNSLGRTFEARGDMRMPRQELQRRALDECTRESLPLIKRTCREAGCR